MELKNRFGFDFIKFIGFKLKNNTEVFSPIEGECREIFLVENNNSYKALEIRGVHNSQDRLFTLVFNDGLNCGENVTKGQFLGKINGGKMKDFKEDNLVLLIGLFKKNDTNKEISSFYVNDNNLISEIWSKK